MVFKNGGANVTVCARSNFEKVRDEGLEIRSKKYGHVRNLKFDRVVRTPSDAAGQKFDFIVCCNKALLDDVPSLPERLSPCVMPEHSTFVIIQNGVGNENLLREAYPKNTIITAVTWVGATQIESGVIANPQEESLTFGGYFTDQIARETEMERISTFKKLLQDAKTPFEYKDHMQAERWRKVIWNGAWNSITSLSNCDTFEFLYGAEPYAMDTARRVMTELISVARALDLDIPYSLVDQHMEAILGRGVGIGSSMQQDLRHSRPMEVECILGIPVREARRLDVSVPTIEAFYSMLTAINKKFKAAQT